MLNFVVIKMYSSEFAGGGNFLGVSNLFTLLLLGCFLNGFNEHEY